MTLCRHCHQRSATILPAHSVILDWSRRSLCGDCAEEAERDITTVQVQVRAIFDKWGIDLTEEWP